MVWLICLICLLLIWFLVIVLNGFIIKRDFFNLILWGWIFVNFVVFLILVIRLFDCNFMLFFFIFFCGIFLVFFCWMFVFWWLIIFVIIELFWFDRVFIGGRFCFCCFFDWKVDVVVFFFEDCLVIFGVFLVCLLIIYYFCNIVFLRDLGDELLCVVIFNILLLIFLIVFLLLEFRYVFVILDWLFYENVLVELVVLDVFFGLIWFWYFIFNFFLIIWVFEVGFSCFWLERREVLFFVLYLREFLECLEYVICGFFWFFLFKLLYFGFFKKLKLILKDDSLLFKLDWVLKFIFMLLIKEF